MILKKNYLFRKDIEYRVITPLISKGHYTKDYNLNNTLNFEGVEKRDEEKKNSST